MNFICPVTFESQCFTKASASVTELQHGATIDSSDSHRQGMFESASLVNQYVGSSCTIPLILTSHRLAQGRDSDVISEDYFLFCKCNFAAMEDRLDVTALGDRSSAIKPKVSLDLERFASVSSPHGCFLCRFCGIFVPARRQECVHEEMLAHLCILSFSVWQCCVRTSSRT